MISTITEVRFRLIRMPETTFSGAHICLPSAEAPVVASRARAATRPQLGERRHNLPLVLVINSIVTFEKQLLIMI